jgi:hypothetical protein
MKIAARRRALFSTKEGRRAQSRVRNSTKDFKILYEKDYVIIGFDFDRFLPGGTYNRP